MESVWYNFVWVWNQVCLPLITMTCHLPHMWQRLLTLSLDGDVATSLLALHWMCSSPQIGCARRITPIYMWREQAIIEWSRRVISINIACCHSVKLCALATQAFRLQQNGAESRMWRSCQVQPSQKEHAIDAVRFKKEGMLLQLLHWRCVECAIHHERDVCEE